MRHTKSIIYIILVDETLRSCESSQSELAVLKLLWQIYFPCSRMPRGGCSGKLFCLYYLSQLNFLTKHLITLLFRCPFNRLSRLTKLPDYLTILSCLLLFSFLYRLFCSPVCLISKPSSSLFYLYTQPIFFYNYLLDLSLFNSMLFIYLSLLTLGL